MLPASGRPLRPSSRAEQTPGLIPSLRRSTPSWLASAWSASRPLFGHLVLRKRSQARWPTHTPFSPSAPPFRHSPRRLFRARAPAPLARDRCACSAGGVLGHHPVAADHPARPVPFRARPGRPRCAPSVLSPLALHLPLRSPLRSVHKSIKFLGATKAKTLFNSGTIRDAKTLFKSNTIVGVVS